MHKRSQIIYVAVIVLLAVISIGISLLGSPLVSSHGEKTPSFPQNNQNIPSRPIPDSNPPSFESGSIGGREGTTPPLVNASPLTGTSWTWIQSEFDGVTAVPKTAGTFAIQFIDSSTVSVKTDCNSMGGEYQVRGDTLTFSNLASTLMYCEGSRESEFSAMLSQVHRFEIRGETLMLYFNKSGVATFSKSIPAEVPPSSTPSAPPHVSNACHVGGCSGQLCTDEVAGAVSICEWKGEYACYKTAVCERQQNGSCGWTMTESLSQCLANQR